jgi:hypothetical protein
VKIILLLSMTGTCCFQSLKAAWRPQWPCSDTVPTLNVPQLLPTSSNDYRVQTHADMA